MRITPLLESALFLMAVTGHAATIYVSQPGEGSTVGKYDATTGAPTNPCPFVPNASCFITVIGGPSDLLLSGNTLFVAGGVGQPGFPPGTVGTYNATTGAVINPNFITGLNLPYGLALSGNHLFVTNAGSGTVGEYDATTGAAINPNFITGLTTAWGLAISGNTLYVTAYSLGTVGEYDATTGAAINPNFITGGAGGPIALSSNKLFVASNFGTIGEYDATTGAAINPNFITGLQFPTGLRLSGNTLLVSDNHAFTVGEYDATTGAAINRNFITVAGPWDAVVAAAGNVTVSGQVSVGGAGLSGVTINVNGSDTTSALTNASGNYSINLTQGGTYTLSAALTGYSLSAPVTFSNLSGNQTANFTGTAVPALEFYPVTPCRLVDTRVSTFQSGFGPPTMHAAETRTFPILSNMACGIPLTAAAYSLNVTVVTKGYLGILTIWPTDQTMPNVSTLNSYSTNGTVVSNAAIVPAGTNGAINVFVTDATDLIIDIDGYFAPPATSGLEFFPVSPCRLVDTRVSSFQSGFGPPTMNSGSTRTFPVPSNFGCGIPATAAAYSLNVTVVPQSTLGFLSIWPTGEPLPNVSTLNVYNPGTVKANAAIVPAGSSGAVNVYVTDQTDVILDINGYFGPSAANGLKFYPATPCREADTRVASFPSGLGPPSMAAGSQRSFPVPQSTCGVPTGAGAYSFNFTAVPQAPQLGIFITWPSGLPQPNVSTMNSYNGSVVSNAAIVPAGANDAISIYVTDATNVLFDINGYFAK